MRTESGEIIQARTPGGEWTRDPDVAERDRRAMRLRASGWTFQRIADELGYASRGACRTAIERCYQTDAAPTIELYRAAMDAQIDELYSATMEVMNAKHLKVVNGSVVFDPTTGGLMEDDAPVLRAVQCALSLLDRRAKLYGLDAPTKVQAQVQAVRVTVEGSEDV